MLNEPSKNIFRACDGKTSFDDLKREYKYTDDLIYLALDELKKNNLIEGDYTTPFVGMSRREVIRKVGFASMVALPMIAKLVAPTAAMAQSTCGGGGVPDGTRVNCPGGLTVSQCVTYIRSQCQSCKYLNFSAGGTCCSVDSPPFVCV